MQTRLPARNRLCPLRSAFPRSRLVGAVQRKPDPAPKTPQTAPPRHTPRRETNWKGAGAASTGTVLSRCDRLVYAVTSTALQALTHASDFEDCSKQAMVQIFRIVHRALVRGLQEQCADEGSGSGH